MSNTALPRELIKWMQSLDLTCPVKTPKWDVSNGYVVAEIFSWYFPQDIHMPAYHNASALNQKLCNWELLRKVIKKHNLDILDEVINATIHCKDGAAFILLQILYETLTNRQLKIIPPDPEIDFTDHGYQGKLPIHARSTAIQALRNNLRFTELMMDRNILTNQLKAQNIIERHTEDRRQQRLENPDRFDQKPTLGELALRMSPKPRYSFQDSNSDRMRDTQAQFEEDGLQTMSDRKISSRGSSAVRRGPLVSEINVNQLLPKAVLSPTSAADPFPSSVTAGCSCGDKILCECCG